MNTELLDKLKLKNTELLSLNEKNSSEFQI